MPIRERLRRLWRRLLGGSGCAVCGRKFAPVRRPGNGEIGMALTACLAGRFDCPACRAAFHGRCGASLGSGREPPGGLRTTCPRCGREFEQRPAFR